MKRLRARRGVSLRSVWVAAAMSIAGVCLLGCEHSGRLLVVVGTDFDVPGEVDTIAVKVTGPEGDTRTLTFPLGEAAGTDMDAGVSGAQHVFDVPLSLVVTPRGGDASRAVTITAIARGPSEDGSGKRMRGRVFRRVHGFVRNETRVVALHVSRACEYTLCGDQLTCDHGACRTGDVRADELPRANQPGQEPTALDAELGPAVDAGAGLPSRVLPIPTVSVEDVAVFPNGDIVVGGYDLLVGGERAVVIRWHWDAMTASWSQVWEASYDPRLGAARVLSLDVNADGELIVLGTTSTGAQWVDGMRITRLPDDAGSRRFFALFTGDGVMSWHEAAAEPYDIGDGENTSSRIAWAGADRFVVVGPDAMSRVMSVYSRSETAWTETPVTLMSATCSAVATVSAASGVSCGAVAGCTQPDGTPLKLVCVHSVSTPLTTEFTFVGDVTGQARVTGIAARDTRVWLTGFASGSFGGVDFGAGGEVAMRAVHEPGAAPISAAERFSPTDPSVAFRPGPLAADPLSAMIWGGGDYSGTAMGEAPALGQDGFAMSWRNRVPADPASAFVAASAESTWWPGGAMNQRVQAIAISATSVVDGLRGVAVVRTDYDADVDLGRAGRLPAGNLSVLVMFDPVAAGL